MFNTEFLLQVIKKERISKYIYTILLLSLLTLGDFFTLFIFSKLIGVYLYLALVASLCFVGTGFIVKSIKKTIKKLEQKHDNGIFPESEFYNITTLFIAVVLVIFPGIVTTLTGFILLFPYLRQLVGRKVTKRLKLDWYAVYEYKEIYNS